MATKNKKVIASTKIFAVNFNKILASQNLNHVEFAKLMKLERHRVERWVKGVAFPKYIMMVKICDFLGYRDIYTLITDASFEPSNAVK